jgi:hypothetical protein
MARKQKVKNLTLKDIYRKHFRVAIFGSARIKPGGQLYKNVFNLAKNIGEHGFDIVTGGGPGLMEAANAGHESGDPHRHADSIGLTIRLPKECKGNSHLEIRKHFNKFSARLDHFMALSNVVVVMPGGIGTCLELFYTWQLTQVKHICPIPIILVGELWEKLLNWVIDYPLRLNYVSPPDLRNIYIAKNNREAFKIIKKAHELFEELGENACLNADQYLLTEDAESDGERRAHARRAARKMSKKELEKKEEALEKMGERLE